MDEERERQQRDLQRATELLETMSREELVDMLHDILFNERSDDTRKLSDWMAFQIIIQDETRDARKLLAQLGKDGRNHRRADTPKLPSATGGSPMISIQGIQGQDDELEEDCSSNASFVTCPETATFQCNPEHKRIDMGILQPTDGMPDETTPAEAHEIDDQSTNGGKSQAGSESKLCENGSALPVVERKGLHHDRLKSASNFPQPVRGLNLASMPFLAGKRQGAHSPVTHLQRFGKTGRVAAKAKAFRTANQRGHANLAELYARFDNVRVEGWRADLLEIDARKVLQQASLTPESTGIFAFDDMNKRRCFFCKLFFTKEQNVRDIDNGSPPCSYHPGVPDWEVPRFRDGLYGWTCCHRYISDYVFKSGLSKTPGCYNGYHYEMELPYSKRLFMDRHNGLLPNS